MAFGEGENQRLGALAHYVIWRCGSMDLGATKLRKILWFSDVEAFRLLGHTVSGATAYEKRQHGPVPKNIYNELAVLNGQGLIGQSASYFFGYERTEYTSLRDPDLAVFSSDELAIVNEVADAVCRNHTAVSISEKSHDVLWEETPTGGDIPVAAAAVTFEKPSDEDIRWAEDAISKL